MNQRIGLFLLFAALLFLAPARAQITHPPRLVVNIGHSGAISSAVFSPDGKLVLSGGADDSVAILWEAATGREIRRFAGHRGAINSVAFSPDGRFVLTGSGIRGNESDPDNSARLWDTATGKEIRGFVGHADAINKVAFSPDGEFVLTGSSDKTARLWETATGNEVRRFIGHSASVLTVAFSPSGKLIATGSGEMSACDDCSARLWNVSTGVEVRRFPGHDLPVESIAFSPDGASVFTGAGPARSEMNDAAFTEAMVRRWDVVTGRELQQFKGYGGLDISSNGRILITSGDDGPQLWSLPDGSPQGYKAKPNEGDGEIVSLALAPDGGSFLAVSAPVATGGNVFTETGTVSMKRIYFGTQAVVDFGGNTNAVKTAAFSSDFKSILAGASVWNSQTGATVSFELDPLGPPVSNDAEVSYSPDGKLVARYHDKPRAPQTDPLKTEAFQYGVWDTETGKYLRELGCSGFISFSNDDRYALCNTVGNLPDGQNFFDYEDISVWSMETGKVVWTRRLNNGLSHSVAEVVSELARFVVNGSQIALVDGWGKENGDGQVTIMDTATGRILQQFSCPKDVILKVSPSGRYIVLTYDSDQAAILYDVVARNQLSQIDLRSDLKILAFSPDEKYLATAPAGEQVTARTEIRETETGRRIAIIADAGTRLKFSSDDQLFLTNDGTSVTVWASETGQLVSRFRHGESGISDASFSPGAEFVISAGDDRTARIWRSKTGVEVCRLLMFGNGDWLVSSPDGRFDTNNLESTTAASFIFPDQPLAPIEPVTFARDYYEPRLLARLLNGEQWPAIRDISLLNRVQPFVAIKAVKPSAADPGSVDVTLEVQSNADNSNTGTRDRIAMPHSSGAYDLRLFRNGQLIGLSTPKDKLAAYLEDAPRLIDETRSSGKLIDTPEDRAWREANDLFKLNGTNVKQVAPDRVEYTFRNVKIPQDGHKETEFTAYAFNSDKVKSATTAPFKYIMPVTVARARKKGQAILVSIGVNASANPQYDLHYAANDAHKMQAIIGERLRADVAKYSAVVEVPLIADYGVDKQPSETTARKAIIKGVFSILAGHPEEVSADVMTQIPNRDKLKAVQPEDTLIITYSGHGYTDPSGIFYLVPFDNGIGTNGIVADGLSKLISSDELSLWMQDVTASEMIMIIDACHSSAAVEGDGFKPGPMGSRGLGQLAYDKDMKILSATQADNIALENDKLEQGLLTYALLQDGVLNSRADADKNKALLSTEWLSYAEKRVPELYQEVKNGKLTVLIDGKATRSVDAAKQLEQTGANSVRLNLQQPSLFDFKRRKTANVLFNLP